MNQIILGTEDPAVTALFGDQSRYQTLPFGDIPPADIGEAAPNAICVLDLSVYESLSPGQKQEIEGVTKLLIIPADAGPVGTFRLSSDCVCFNLENRGARCLHNLEELASSLSNSRILFHRLNSYIKDSFSDIVDSSLLARQKIEIEALNEKLKEISRIDYLTNLLNRRALLESFELEKNRALRCRWRIQNLEPEIDAARAEPGADYASRSEGSLKEHLGNFACLMIDIDHFKRVNDTYGHLVGDQVLKQFSELIRMKGLFRDTDVMGRYGGEEFVILLPETNSEHAVIPAQRLREAMKNIVFEDSLHRQFHVTISIGVSEFLPAEASTEELIKRADDALYYAKEHGRDQVCIYESTTGQILQALAV